MKVLARNASQGVARNIRVKWAVRDPLSGTEFSAIQLLLPAGKEIRLANGNYAAEFLEGGVSAGRLPVSVSGATYAGDLGPGQELLLEAPAPVINHACLKWLANIERITAGQTVMPAQVPALEITFTHDSPYERDLRDEHVGKLYLVEYGFFNAAGRRLRTLRPSNWRTLRLNLSLEFSSPEIEALPTVVV